MGESLGFPRSEFVGCVLFADASRLASLLEERRQERSQE
jgi:hypothetical protein